ncbi:MAG: hypothetical protein IJU48_00430 [Synergistaceae bacterium]|nr:hypothetical protein [Synergistaceae bacterium]
MQVDVEQCKEHLAELLGKIHFGDEHQIIITQHGMPIAKMTEYPASPRKYKLGVADGKFIIPDDWDVKDAEIAEMFGVK